MPIAQALPEQNHANDDGGRAVEFRPCSRFRSLEKHGKAVEAFLVLLDLAHQAVRQKRRVLKIAHITSSRMKVPPSRVHMVPPQIWPGGEAWTNPAGETVAGGSHKILAQHAAKGFVQFTSEKIGISRAEKSKRSRPIVVQGIPFLAAKAGRVVSSNRLVKTATVPMNTSIYFLVISALLQRCVPLEPRCLSVTAAFYWIASCSESPSWLGIISKRALVPE